MKSLLFAFALAISAGATPQNTNSNQTLPVKEGVLEVAVRAVNDAQTNVYVEANSLISSPIAKALVRAHRRGVHVEVIFDKAQQAEGLSPAFLSFSGLPTLIDHDWILHRRLNSVPKSDSCLKSSFGRSHGFLCSMVVFAT